METATIAKPVGGRPALPPDRRRGVKLSFMVRPGERDAVHKLALDQEMTDSEFLRWLVACHQQRMTENAPDPHQ